MAEHRIQFFLEKETPGTFMYRELDEHGKPMPNAKGKIGAVYIRKTTFNGSVRPQRIELILKY